MDVVKSRMLILPSKVYYIFWDFLLLLLWGLFIHFLLYKKKLSQITLQMGGDMTSSCGSFLGRAYVFIHVCVHAQPSMDLA